ncbi:unnamed protein product [Strongylus vulgaris]|uniref:Uncharacterized protein n=1 Tax=Strongylus vulgaris TaxID=40348 RepID=A0A3P7LCD5_STRVU|nr:unnamed protein product [Strongylus vulgaris]
MRDTITLSPNDLNEIRIDSMQSPIKMKACKSQSLPEGRLPYRRESNFNKFKYSIKKNFKGSLRRSVFLTHIHSSY